MRDEMERMISGLRRQLVLSVLVTVVFGGAAIAAAIMLIYMGITGVRGV